MNQSGLLILGANGQLGRALTKRLPDAKAASRAILDITDAAAVNAYDWSGVDVIINAAAYTKVDDAETPDGRRAAWAANASAVGNLARIATKHDITLVHVSSEYVFDGTQDNHPEDEPLSPLSAYGTSKAAGDIAAQTASKHYILRTSWVIGEGHNFVRTMMGLAAKNISPTVVGDQIGRLTFTDTLVDAIEILITNNSSYGIYNISNSGDPASWADITRAVFKALGRDDLTVTDTTTADYFANKPQAARRPLKSTLSLNKITAAGVQLRDWRDDLAAYIEQNKE